MQRYDKTDLPRGNFHIRIPETGFDIYSNHPSDFLSRIREHMEINNIPITGGWKERVWDEACRQHPECGCLDDGAPQKKAFTSDDVWRFLTTLWKAYSSGAERVSMDEQDRRLNICRDCPKLTTITCALGCGKLAEVLSNLALGGGRPIQSDMHKKNCGVCGCELTSMSSYPLEILRKVDEELQPEGEYPKHCWKRG